MLKVTPSAYMLVYEHVSIYIHGLGGSNVAYSTAKQVSSVSLSLCLSAPPQRSCDFRGVAFKCWCAHGVRVPAVSPLLSAIFRLQGDLGGLDPTMTYLIRMVLPTTVLLLLHRARRAFWTLPWKESVHGQPGCMRSKRCGLDGHVCGRNTSWLSRLQTHFGAAPTRHEFCRIGHSWVALVDMLELVPA